MSSVSTESTLTTPIQPPRWDERGGATENAGTPRDWTVRVRRRPTTVSPSHLDPGGAGVQAAVLRVGARLPMAAHAPAPGLRGPLLRTLARDPRWGQRAVLRRRAADQRSAVHVLRGGDGGRGDIGRGPREPRAQDPLPASGRAGGGRADRRVQPRHEPRGGDRFRP